MPLFLITGLPGTGKSTVLDELISRRYEVYGGDEDGFSHWHNNQTGFVHPKSSVKAEHRTPEFIQSHIWKMSRKMIEDLAPKAKNKPLFICGNADNEAEIKDLFSGIFALVADDETLKYRLATRTGNDWGKAPHELKVSLEARQKAQEASRKFAYITIDSTQPVEAVVNSILEKAGV